MNVQEPSEEDEVGTQNEPVMDVPYASDADKLAGIIRQTIRDLGDSHPVAQMTAVVIQRASDSGLDITVEHITTAVQSAAREP